MADVGQNDMNLFLRVILAGLQAAVSAAAFTGMILCAGGAHLVALAPATFGSWALPLFAAAVCMTAYLAVLGWHCARQFETEMVTTISRGVELGDDPDGRQSGALALMIAAGAFLSYAFGVGAWKMLERTAVVPSEVVVIDVIDVILSFGLALLCIAGAAGSLILVGAAVKELGLRLLQRWRGVE